MEITHCQHCRKPLNQHDDLICAKWHFLYTEIVKNKDWISKILQNTKFTK